MAEKHKIRDFDLLSGYDYFIPGPIQIIALVAFLIAGAVAGNLVAAAFMLLMPGAAMDSLTLISYPVMFIPAMLYAISASRRNTLFDTGFRLDSMHFGKAGGVLLSVMAMVATLAAAFLTDIVNVMMPPVPDWLETVFRNMTQGNFVMNFVCVSVFAPFFEEWLCRGMVLRGLLNCSRRKNGTPERGIRPVWAIVLSALFFALIHMNPWQAVPAFVIGCLFGYVYYRTGSLKITMAMHFANNTFALIMSNVDSLKDMDTWFDVLPAGVYCVVAVLCAALLLLFVKMLNGIPLESVHGNCDEILVM